MNVVECRRAQLLRNYGEEFDVNRCMSAIQTRYDNCAERAKHRPTKSLQSVVFECSVFLDVVLKSEAGGHNFSCCGLAGYLIGSTNKQYKFTPEMQAKPHFGILPKSSIDGLRRMIEQLLYNNYLRLETRRIFNSATLHKIFSNHQVKPFDRRTAQISIMRAPLKAATTTITINV